MLADSGTKCGNCILECNSNSLHIAQTGNQNVRYAAKLETTLNFNCIFLHFCPCYLFLVSCGSYSILVSLGPLTIVLGLMKSMLSIAGDSEGTEEVLKGRLLLPR